MFVKRSRIVCRIFLLLNFSLFFPLSFSALAQQKVSPASFRYREDVDGNGKVSIHDVISLLLLGLDSPGDPRADYNGDGKVNIIDAITLIVNIAKENLSAEALSAGSWRVVGPGGGGAQYLPTVNPIDPGNVFVRCDMTGAYVTADNARSWRMFNLRTVVNDFEIDPSQPKTVYAASSALYRSDDGGLGWRLIYPDPGEIVAEHMVGDHAEQWFETAEGLPGGEVERVIVKVRVDPSNSDHLWLARSNSWDSPPYTVLVSNDRGASWSTLAENPTGNVLAIFPGQWWDRPEEAVVITENTAVRVSEETGQSTVLTIPGSPLIAAEGGKGNAGVILYALTVNNVYSSSNLGVSWQSRKSGVLNDVGSFTALAACENQPEKAYLACGWTSNSEFGNFKTTDSGASWSWVYRANSTRILSNNYSAGWLDKNYGPGWREYSFGLGVCPTNPDICYATDWAATIRTTDGGAHWEQVYTDMLADGSARSRGLDVTTCYGVHFDPFDSLHIFISYTDIGAFQSFDGGESWVQAIDGIPDSWRNTCYWMVFDPEVQGRAWSAWGSAHDLPRHKMFRNGFEGKTGGVAVTDNSCKTWRASNSGLPASSVCTHIVLDPQSLSGSRTLYVCAFRQGVFKSTDCGQSWKATGTVPGTNRNYWRLALLPDGKLFVLIVRDRQGSVEFDGGLFRSADRGASWQQVTLPEGVNFPNDLVYDPSNPDRMFLSCWPWTKVGEQYKGDWLRTEVGGGLLLSEDGGSSWRRVFRDDAHVYAAAIDPDNPSKVYINTFDSAAFHSADSGETWSRIKGYNFKWGHRPVVDPHNPGMLYLTTFGGSVFHGPASGDPAAVEDILDFPDSWRWGD
ncbi:MAG TPA: hypothetical protein VM123_17825 [archaeon]|nr:hypothetical protein [archaeon]